MKMLNLTASTCAVTHATVEDAGEQLLGVAIDEETGKICLSIDDGEGNCMVAELDDEQLDKFADNLGHAIEKLNERLRAFPSTLKH